MSHLLDAGQGGLGAQHFQQRRGLEDVQVVVLQVGAHGQALQAQQRGHGQPDASPRLGRGPEEVQPLLRRVQACMTAG